MKKNKLLHYYVIMLFSFLLLCSKNSYAGEIEDLIKQGIKLHDAGKYDDAIAAYQQALKQDKDNADALYEMTYSYSAKKDFKQCYEIAKKGLNLKSKIKNMFFIVGGSCLSDEGNLKAAAQLYKNGAEQFPRDALLQYNYAIVLYRQKDIPAAIQHSEIAINNKPDYASPYFLLAEIYRAQQKPSLAIYLYMQFFMLEPKEARAPIASKNIFALLEAARPESGKDGKLSTSIFANTDDPKNTLELELALRMVLSNEFIKKKSDKKSDNMRKLDSLIQFVKVSYEMKNKFSQTLIYEKAIKPIFELYSSQNLETFCYILAQNAEIPEAEGWLQKHPKEYEKLAKQINSIFEGY